jgi:hypothetical protein
LKGAEHGAKFRVAVRTIEIYRSPNGDRWLLARDPETGRVFVRHEPNLPSGGQVANIEIGPNVIASPHNSAQGTGAHNIRLRRAVENCRRALTGEMPLHVIGLDERLM